MLVNFTSHTIVIDTAHHRLVLPPAGQPPVITEQRTLAPPLRHGDVTVPFWKVTPGDVAGLLDPVPGTWFIVARPVALAAPGRPDLLVPYDLRRDKDGNVAACAALARLTRSSGIDSETP